MLKIWKDAFRGIYVDVQGIDLFWKATKAFAKEIMIITVASKRPQN